MSHPLILFLVVVAASVLSFLFSGMEAYVSAHLQDFPPDLKLQAMPNGIGVTVPLPRIPR